MSTRMRKKKTYRQQQDPLQTSPQHQHQQQQQQRNMHHTHQQQQQPQQSLPMMPFDNFHFHGDNGEDKQCNDYSRDTKASEGDEDEMSSCEMTSSSSGSSEEGLKPSSISVFSAMSTLHGLSHIFAVHQSRLRCFSWAMAFAVSFALLLYQSSNRVMYYLSYPHITRLDEVNAGDLDFPAVTICNLNEFRFNKITKRDMYHAGSLLGFLDDQGNLKKPNFHSRMDSLDDVTKQLIKNVTGLANFTKKGAMEEVNIYNDKFSMMEFYNRTGHDLNTMLKSCRYQGKRCVDIDPNKKWRQAHNRYNYYMSSPHVTKLDELEAVKLDFPSLTICNINRFRFSKVDTDDYYFYGKEFLNVFNTDYSIVKNISLILNQSIYDQLVNKTSPIMEQRTEYKTFSKSPNMFEFYNRTGHDIRSIIKTCRYQNINCSDENLDKYWHAVFTRYGKCYTFNDRPPYLKTVKGGIDNGLELVLDSQQNEYMPVWKETDEISLEAGFKVQIHTQKEPPFIHELGFGVSPGFQTLVATQEQRITFLPKPWGSCRDTPNKTEHVYFDDYSISGCRITCETEYVFKKCDCIMVHMPNTAEKRRICEPEEYKACADVWLDKLTSGNDSECSCETPCEVIRYNLEMSTLRFPSEQARSFLAYKYNVTEDYVKRNFLKINVFFEALNYETIEQKVAYEVPGLFGDIGGQMGLFIGASILTILELFDYVYEVIKDKIWGRKLSRKKDGNGSRKAEERGRRNNNQHVAVETDVSHSILPPTGNSIANSTAPPEYQQKNCRGLNKQQQHTIYGTQLFDSQLSKNTRQSSNSGGGAAQYHGVGNFLMTLKEDDTQPRLPDYQMRYDPEHQQVTGGGKMTRRNVHGGIMARETSMSYNDLYRAHDFSNATATLPPDVGCSFTMTHHSRHKHISGRGSTAPYPIGAASSSSCLNSLTNPRGGGGQQHASAFSPNGVTSLSSSQPQHNNNQSTSFMGGEYDSTNPDYPLPMETDIH